MTKYLGKFSEAKILRFFNEALGEGKDISLIKDKREREKAISPMISRRIEKIQAEGFPDARGRLS